MNEYKFHTYSSDQFDEMIVWCRKNLYHGGNYEPNWYASFPFIYFKDERDYLLFVLRWL